uniref:Ribonuclease H-like domain, reverse transcriptase, RNA-dependent DNA polymerase n=1 Tax=Tanacetum cinerariifolium TaxID=118510 RepID=A0A699X1G6_TANCI|nr:ribonuclease H-like domain, reverse transcriptase, RNA-dependent DNA polymerase [Tanacetum cinerariifolium]
MVQEALLLLQRILPLLVLPALVQKRVYSDQPSYSSLISYTPAPSVSIMEDVLLSFVAKNEPKQQLAYEDFKQVDQLEMEELDIKW